MRTTVPPPRWSSSAARAHAVVVSVLTPAEVLIAARRLAGARPHLVAVAGIVHREDLWQLCRGELTGYLEPVFGRPPRSDGPPSRVVDTVIWCWCPRRTGSGVTRVTCASPLVAAAFCSAPRARSLRVDMSMTQNRRSQPRSGGMLEITGESTSASTAGMSGAAGSASSSGPRRGSGSCHPAR